ncbi:uncharacterized protein BX664DRAFT_260599 [Halteromyces radiatus]|uniref:uncharacterized protein n=1 Tax=Halteromyces radiatus TaxID=101107 RepID=UPI00222066FF|nr:uncharacterized protein BX664DRAFT_260599 [Halteromyces radiatus]KAI8093643.1 hypothetical protein BX664DRAFT_260599 [Halteromyces radiatus]
MLLELVLPIILYYIFRMFLSPLLSLLLAGVPAAMIVAFKGIHEHKVDMTGVLTLVGFIVSAVLATVQADPKLYLLRESTMTLAMGFMLLVTLLPLQIKHHRLRPFMFYVARQIAVSGSLTYDDPNTVRQHWDWFWDAWPTFRDFFRTLTGLWAMGLISEFILRVALLRSMEDVDDVLYYSNIYMFVVLGILGSLTIASTLLLRHLYNKEQQKMKDDERHSEIRRIIDAAANEDMVGGST